VLRSLREKYNLAVDGILAAVSGQGILCVASSSLQPLLLERKARDAASLGLSSCRHFKNVVQK
jgi:hypothetical protein